MKKYFFYLTGKDQNGPISFEELLTKGISGDTLIWSEGMENWQKLKDIPELKQAIKLAPPPPPKDSGEEKLKIEINDDLFFYPNNGELVGATYIGIIDGKESKESFLYILNNQCMTIDRDLPIPGLSFTFISCNDKISFFFINEKNLKLFKLFDVKREDIKELKVVNNQKYQATLYKSSSGISATGVGTIMGANILNAVPIVGPIIGALLGAGIGHGVSKLKAKIKENSPKTIEKTGTIFHLICNRGNQEFTISIACESSRAKLFELFMQKTWSVDNPYIQKNNNKK